jgi:hypothetical protein
MALPAEQNQIFQAIGLISASKALELTLMVNCCISSFDWLTAFVASIIRLVQDFLAGCLPI